MPPRPSSERRVKRSVMNLRPGDCGSRCRLAVSSRASDSYGHHRPATDAPARTPVFPSIFLMHELQFRRRSERSAVPRVCQERARSALDVRNFEKDLSRLGRERVRRWSHMQGGWSLSDGGGRRGGGWSLSDGGGRRGGGWSLGEDGGRRGGGWRLRDGGGRRGGGWSLIDCGSRRGGGWSLSDDGGRRGGGWSLSDDGGRRGGGWSLSDDGGR